MHRFLSCNKGLNCDTICFVFPNMSLILSQCLIAYGTKLLSLPSPSSRQWHLNDSPATYCQRTKDFAACGSALLSSLSPVGSMLSVKRCCTVCRTALSHMAEPASDWRDGGSVLKFFRYVDDFWVILKKGNFPSFISNIFGVFRQLRQGLVFTHKIPNSDQLQSLDLKLHFTLHHACWACSPRAKRYCLMIQPTLNLYKGVL